MFKNKLLHLINKKALVKQKGENMVGPNLQQKALHIVHGSTCRQKISRKMLKQGLIISIYIEKKNALFQHNKREIKKGKL